ncbi:hypothetical protein BSL78_00492 [Apostichopus japonicus]|uniref:Uncharacterized protein n=1 Tax=Stichopus japonicus TaxID=307972 RepID=A0A2G8LQP7_STIJA|nr:hypothetical protein BSL78_00492 [Apostichopus japonicus]
MWEREGGCNQQRQRRPPAPPPQRGPPLFLDRGKRRMDPRSGGLRGGDRPSKRMRPPPPLMHGQDNPRDVLVSGSYGDYIREYQAHQHTQLPLPPPPMYSSRSGFSYDPNMPGACHQGTLHRLAACHHRTAVTPPTAETTISCPAVAVKGNGSVTGAGSVTGRGSETTTGETRTETVTGAKTEQA